MKATFTVAAGMILLAACASGPAPTTTAAAARLAAPTAQATAPKPVKVAANPDKQVCKRETPLGGHIPVKTCHTQAEWDAMSAANRENARDLTDAAHANASLNH